MKEMNPSANSLYRLASLSMHTHTHTQPILWYERSF